MDVAAPSPTSRRVLVPVVVVILLGLLVAAVLVWNTDRGPSSASLDPAAGPGPDPFLDAAATSSPAVFTDTVRARVVEGTADRDVDATTGTRHAAGDTEGLYAASPEAPACDVGALSAGLTADPATAAAWAAARGIAPGAIPDHLASLFPAHLTVDTLVTNHRLVGGHAQPVVAVLEAGTAVLVDAWGLPAVRCACGNPLLPPPRAGLGGVTPTGTPWQGFDPSGVHTVLAASSQMETLAALDVATAEVMELRTTASSREQAAPVFLAVSQEGDALVPADTGARRGAIHRSGDGVTWEKVLDTTALSAIDTGPGLAVAVGWGGEDGNGGVVHTSTDGRDWSAPIEVVDPLVDVAFGDGVWVAVGNRSFTEESGEGDGSAGAVYLSTDGTSWERVATTSPYDNPHFGSSGDILHQSIGSVAHGNGTWLLTATECAYRTCELVLFTSPDAREWTRHTLDPNLLRMDLDHDGTSWGFVGAERDPAGVTVNMAERDRPLGLAGTSEDGTTWQTGATAPDRPVLAGLGRGADAWYAVDAPTYGTRGFTPSRGDVHRSEDLRTWEVVGTVTEGTSGIAVLTGSGPPSPAPSGSATPTSPAVEASASTSPGASASPGSPPGASSPTTAAATRILVRTGGIALDTPSGPGDLIPFEGPASAALDALTAALGPPEGDFFEGDGHCAPASTGATWKGLTIRHEGRDPTGTWWLRLQGGSGDLPALPVATSEGVTLGMTLDEVARLAPGVVPESWAYEGVTWSRFMLDVTPDGERGTEVMAQGPTVTSIGAPVWVTGDC